MNPVIPTTTSTTSPTQGANLIVTHAFHLADAEVAVGGLIAITFVVICAVVRRVIGRWR